MRVIVALIKAEGKSQKEVFKTLTEAGLELHDICTVTIAKTTKRVRV
jgi:hypothetical protein